MTRATQQTLVAFVLGAVVGVVGTARVAPGAFHRRWESGQFQARMLQRFSAKLQLAPAQRTQVAAILEAKRLKIDALRADIRPKFEEIRALTSAEIRALLTPAQQKKFDVMQAEWETRRKRWRAGPAES